MRAGGARRLQIRRGVVISLACLLALVALDRVGALEALDLKLGDLRMRARGERPVSDLIALIEVDDATIQAYGRWPLPRDTYALLIVAANRAGARAIGLDLLFLGHDSEAERSDLLLAGASAGSGNVVHAIAFMPKSPGLGAGESPPGPALQALRRHGVSAPRVRATVAGSVSIPFTELLQSARAIGHVTVAVDPDGGIRRAPLVVRYADRVYPALGLRLAGIAAGDTALPALLQRPGAIEVVWPSGRKRMIPVDDEGGTAIDFAGDRASVRHSYSMIDVLRWYREGDAAKLKAAFDGRIVLVGTTAVKQAVTDVGTTPFATTTPLVYVHANVVDSLLRNHFLRPPSEVLHLAVLAALALMLGWLYVILALPIAAGVMAGATCVSAAAVYIPFAASGIDVRPTVALLLPAVAYAAVASYRFVFLEKNARERERELEVARSIQRRLLPESPPDTRALDVYGFNVPALEVGGDYYDWVPLGDSGWAFVLGDVSGKGVSAALLMSHLHALLHAEAKENHQAMMVLSSLNEALFRATEPQRFATFFLAAIPAAGGSVVFSNAGHNPALLVHEGNVEALGPTGIPLGMLEGSKYGEEERRFEPGDVLVLYSDGVTECMHKGQMYGEDRLEALVRTLARGGASARQVCDAILEDVRAFAHGGPYSDDVTVLVVRRRVPGEGP
jgi:serine phosphatase RsbU (regulator of sigma subunit)